MAKQKPTSTASDYEVGRGKPPRASRFRPGQSGNPGGRKKGSLNLKTMLIAVMESEIELTENGRKRKAPVLEAILLRQAQEAMRGDIRATDSLLNRYERLAEVGAGQNEELPEEDQALLDRILNARGRTKAPTASGSRKPARRADRDEETDHD